MTPSISPLLFLLLATLSSTATAEYVHVDVSGDFANEAKIVTTVLAVATFAGMNYFSFQKKHSANLLVALIGSWLMVVLRTTFLYTGRKESGKGFVRHHKQGNGPYFDITRCVLLEPLVFLWASMLLTALIGKNYGKTSTFRTTVWRSALWIQTTGKEEEEPTSDWVHLATTMGSSLVFTGSVSGMAILVKAYDEILWRDFVRDMFLPVLASTMLGAVALLIRHSVWPNQEQGVSSGRSEDNSDYSTLALQDDVEDNIDKTLITNEDEEEVLGCNGTVETQDDTTFETREEPPEEATPQEASPCLWGLRYYEALPILVLALLYAFHWNVILVLSSVAALLALWKTALHFHFTLFEEPLPLIAASPDAIIKIITSLDYGSLLWNISVMILVGGWTDTGVPSSWIDKTLGRCADQMTSGQCLYPTSVLFAAISAIFSPLAAVLIWGDTYPYATPYDWMQLAFAVSIGGSLCLISGGSCFWTTPGNDGPWVLRVQGVACLVALFLGATVLAYFHVSFQCSVRLGECMG